MLLKPHYFVGPTHGFDFISKNLPISSLAVLLFLLEIIRKDSTVKIISFKKALFIMISELLRILNTEWGCDLSIFFSAYVWLHVVCYLSQHVFILYLFVDVICVCVRIH